MTPSGPRDDAASETPLACDPAALSTAERTFHRDLAMRLADAIARTIELTDGYAFELDPGKVPASDLAAWVDFERRCCPFFDIALEWRREGGPVVVRLTGREGVKPFIRAEFPTIGH